MVTDIGVKDRILWVKNVKNPNRQWFEVWKPEYIEEKYYLIMDRGYLVLGEKVEVGNGN